MGECRLCLPRALPGHSPVSFLKILKIGVRNLQRTDIFAPKYIHKPDTQTSYQNIQVLLFTLMPHDHPPLLLQFTFPLPPGHPSRLCPSLITGTFQAFSVGPPHPWVRHLNFHPRLAGWGSICRFWCPSEGEPICRHRGKAVPSSVTLTLPLGRACPTRGPGQLRTRPNANS